MDSSEIEHLTINSFVCQAITFTTHAPWQSCYDKVLYEVHCLENFSQHAVYLFIVVTSAFSTAHRRIILVTYLSLELRKLGWLSGQQSDLYLIHTAVVTSNASSCSRSLLKLAIDLIAALGEATATPYFIYRLRDAMLSDPTGRRILRDRPRISSTTLSLDYLRSLPGKTVGRAYADWLDREGVSPDTRAEVQYIDDEECAYVMQRYRECHDFFHALTGLPTVVEGEVALKAFEFANTLLPMTGLSVFALTRMKPEERKRFFTIYGPWAVKNGLGSKEVINIYWEEQLERDVEELRVELGLEKPVDLRDIRKRERARKKADREAKKRARDSLGIN